jgi:hypothetical protein
VLITTGQRTASSATPSAGHNQRIQRRAEFAVVAGLVIAGVFLRLPGLRMGLWRDEGATYFDIVATSLRELLHNVSVSELNPPGFFVLMHYWADAVGAGEIAFKMPAFLCGVLLIPATYFLTRGLTASVPARLVAATVATVAPEAVFYSQEARPYTLAALLVCCTLMFYIRSVTERGSLAPLVGFVICGVLALYVHYTILLLFAALTIVTTIFWRGGRLSGRALPIVSAMAVVFALFGPWLPIFLTHLTTGTPWASKLPLLQRGRLIYDNIVYVLPVPVVGTQYEPLRKAALLLLVIALIIAAWRAFHGADGPAVPRSPSRVDALAIAAATFVVVTLMLASLSYSGRYLFPFLPVAWALGSMLVVNLFGLVQRQRPSAWSVWTVRGIATLLVLAVLVPNVRYAVSLGTHEKSGIRALAADLRRQTANRTLYVVSPDTLAATLGYYMRDRQFELHGIPRWSRPEIFSPLDYQDLWNSPALVAETIARIRNHASQGVTHLVLVQPLGGISDAGVLPLSRADEVFRFARHTYPLLMTTDYDGLLESVTIYLFALTPESHIPIESVRRF